MCPATADRAYLRARRGGLRHCKNPPSSLTNPRSQGQGTRTRHISSVMDKHLFNAKELRTSEGKDLGAEDFEGRTKIPSQVIPKDEFCGSGLTVSDN